MRAAGRCRLVPWRVVSSVALAVAVVGACGDDESLQAAGPYAVGSRSVTFVDEQRPTPAFGPQPEQPNRTVVTDLWYPAEGPPGGAAAPDAPAADGPFPVIVFNHGQQGEPIQYALAFETWARAGYVVAAPRHPLTVRGGPGAQFANDIPGELGDVPFVISSIEDELGDLADVDHLAVAGHSSGAIVAFGVAFNTCCHDDRVDAVLVEAVQPVALEGEYAADLQGTPILFVHGDTDSTPIGEAHRMFEEASSPKYFLTVAGGDHSGMYRDGPQAQLVADAALAFFDLHLRERSEALTSLQGVPGIEAVP